MRNPHALWFAPLILVASVAAPRSASADWLIGSSMTISVDDSPLGTSFSQNVTLGPGTTVLDQGELTLTQTLVSVSPGTQWIVLDYQATGGRLIGADPNINWEYSAIGKCTPSIGAQWFFNWTIDGSFINSINEGGPWAEVGPDPINPALGNVFNYMGPLPAAGSFDMYAQIYPYSYNGASGVDISKANGFIFGGLITAAPVPEPSTLALCGIGGIVLACAARIRKARHDSTILSPTRI
jgi:hypothetical protein